MTNQYDEIPYPSGIFKNSHPNKLATIATFFGMHPPDVGRCRVLELGCAAGNNLLAMALIHPESRFVGVDYSAKQVETGNHNIHALGIRNVELHHLDIQDITPELGMFDYIIAHGVYSWVPEAIQEKIMQTCHDLLVPNGVAYISYNTYPGWHTNGMIREMMLYHTQHLTDSRERIRQAKALLHFLAEATENTDETGEDHHNFYNLSLKKTLNELSLKDDGYFFHEYLEENNAPVFFHQFVETAHRHGLEYLGDPNIRSMLTFHLPKKVMETFKRLGNDLIRQEQYMDFLRNRTFRRSLLCHREARITRRVDAEVVDRFYIAANLKPVSPSPDMSPDVKERFKDGSGKMSVETGSPLVKAVCVCLGRAFPGSLRFSDLIEEASGLPAARIVDHNQSSEAARKTVREFLLRMYIDNRAEFYFHPAALTIQAGAKPIANPLARLQVTSGSKTACNLLGESIQIEPLARYLMPHLNGAADRDALLSVLQTGIEKGELILKMHEKTPSPAETENHSHLLTAIDNTLQLLAKQAFLIS